MIRKKAGSQTIHGTLALPTNYINKLGDLKIRVVVEKEIPVYQVTLMQTAGGTIESDLEEAEEGTSVTLTAVPDEGYKLIPLQGHRRGDHGSRLVCRGCQTRNLDSPE